MAMSPRLLRPVASGSFDPRTLSGLKLWLDAADSASVTLDVSNNVSQWADKSGYGNTASQTIAANRPDYAGTINGKNVIGFAGSPETLLGTGFLSGAVTPTIFAVGNGTSGGNAQQCFVDLSYTLVGNGELFSSTYEPAIRVGAGATTFAGGQITDASVVVYGVTSANVSSGYCYVNGAERTGTPGSRALNLTGAGFAIGSGSNFNAGFYLQGIIGEILVYDRVLTSTERQAVERALGRKWGITVA